MTARKPRNCRDCGTDIGHRGRRSVRCEPCQEVVRRETHNAATRRYRERNPDRGTEDSRRWRAANPDRYAETRRRYYEKVRESRTEYLREYRAANRDKRREYDRAWRAANPDAVRRYREQQQANRRAAEAARRARKAVGEAEQIDHAEIFERDGWVCGLCSQPVDRETTWPNQMSPSLDHVLPLSKGGRHVGSNVQLAHLICNQRKNNRVEAS